MNHLFITYEIQDVLGYQSAHLLFQFLCIQIVHKHSLGSCKVPKVPHKIQAHQFSRSDVYWTSKDKTSKVYRDVDILNPKNISIYIIHIKCSLNLSYQKKNFQKNCNIFVFFPSRGNRFFCRISNQFPLHFSSNYKCKNHRSRKQGSGGLKN